ncbi:GAF domain-containing protein [Roseicella aerolata]|uniref:GAF domain-containing protein n=1 Tax=Roseicella aerolata TaxID=2883479 RepID=A0A9X1IIJ2_9PROT|nr:GAF domain-containing protein [Roseicella aerolata]MCB4824806.1 GAF domain-containing protein [Roseicella aerolata]
MPEAGASLTPAQLARLAAAARAPGPLALLRAADEVGREAMGHRLCTAMRFDAAAMTVQRIYSSDPLAYPVGGAKPKRDTAWGRHVLLEQRVFTGEGEAAIRAHFDDHAVIAGLGLRSIVNVPVVLRGLCRGTLNFLWAEEQVPAARVALAELLGLVAAADWAAMG